MRTIPPHVTLALLLLLPPALTQAAEPRALRGPYVETDALQVVLIPRTPEQMAAFYEARGFPPAAIERIRRTCFVTVHIENRSRDIIWLDLDQWTFTSAGQPLHRLAGTDWNAQWDEIDLRQASRSTFGWTQLPALRDLQPDESVGGNLVFPGDTGTLTVAARFPVGAGRQGKALAVGFGGIQCGQAAATP
ncbi:MAG: hypothetical protein R3F42_11710 [Pseudomonadota bacterium]